MGLAAQEKELIDTFRKLEAKAARDNMLFYGEALRQGQEAYKEALEGAMLTLTGGAPRYAAREAAPAMESPHD